MPTTKEAVEFTHELIRHILGRAKRGLSDKAFSKDIQTVTRVVGMQAKHLENSSAALAQQAEDLKSDLQTII